LNPKGFARVALVKTAKSGRKPMIKASIGIAFGAASMFLAFAGTAHAESYRWCAYYSGGFAGGGTNCGFVTLSQCRATISGAGGYCEPNPRYSGATDGRARHRHKDSR
jgi:hypothetical protein